MHTHKHRTIALTVALAAILALGLLALAPGIGGAQESGGTYTNPVSKGFADTFADPAVIKAKDGYWYAYGTTDPLNELQEGETEKDFRTVPISRSKDLVNWEYVGDAFDGPSEVSWADTDAALWAPDIRYFNGKYYLYYVVTQTAVTPDRNDNAVGVATAPTPTGPWTDSGAPVVGPRRGGPGDNFLWTFDPNEFTALDGERYLYYGSYYGGIYVTKLSKDGTRAVGPQTMVAIDNRYEGSYVVERDGYYYLFGSSANCCAGPTTGYSVYVGRSKDPRGPFLDKEGQSMTESRVGGSIVITPNGNKWIGTGHNAVVTDLSGQDWFAYHAIDRADPYLDEPFGINERPFLLDRLDWIDGWPTVRGGRWASEDAQPAPVTDGPVNDDFNRRTSLGREWDRDGGAWRLVKKTNRQGYARQQGASRREGFLVSRSRIPNDARVEADLRLKGGRATGVVVRYDNNDNYAAAWLDRRADALVTEVVVRGRTSREAAPLPRSFEFDEWHNVAVEVRGSEMYVEVTDARLNDPYAVAERTLPRALSDGQAGVASLGGRVEADNVSAARLYEPRARTAPTPEPGALRARYSDEFNDAALGPEWSWVRQPDGQETGGAYRWPVQSTDLVGPGNNASVLLRDAPDGEYIVETKLTIDLGVGDVRNFQQGGLIAYAGDDHFARLSHVAIWNTRQTEFGKEMPFAGALSYGGMLVGPPADTTWLRLAHRVDSENGEHEYRAATSRDGRAWVWGGVWTLPAGTEPRIGLVSHGKQTGGEDPPATAQFDYFRVYRP